jgi:hypothetical protein
MNKSTGLRQIAISVRAFGFLFKQPSLSLAASNLLRLADEFEPEYQEDVRRIMEKGLPPAQSGSGIIKSNYLLEDADIYFSISTKFYDVNDRPVELPDTIETQQKLIKEPHRVSALIIWPDIDILAEYDSSGDADTSQSHGGPAGHTWPDEIGVKNFDDVMAAAGPGSLVTNARFKELAASHDYQTPFMFDWY